MVASIPSLSCSSDHDPVIRSTRLAYLARRCNGDRKTQLDRFYTIHVGIHIALVICMGSSIRHTPEGDSAIIRAVERTRAGHETGDAEADPPEKRGRLASDGKRAARAPTDSAGVVAAAHMEEGDG